MKARENGRAGRPLQTKSRASCNSSRCSSTSSTGWKNIHSLIFGLPWGLKGAVGVGEALVVALAGGFVSNS